MRKVVRHPLRVAGRLAGFLGVTGGGWWRHRWEQRGVVGEVDPRVCAAWMHRYAQATLRRLNLSWSHTGTVPTSGLVVSNHLGYLDIPALAATGPMVFVSKAEVAYWPWLGSLARCGGTLFLKRERRGHVASVASALGSRVNCGVVVGLFPEGTSTGGDTVLPFRSSLLEPAVVGGWPVTPAAVHYLVPGGVVSEDVAYWRDMTFAPHFLNLLAQDRILVRVAYGEPVVGMTDRKALARRLQEDVGRLLRGLREGG